MEERVMAEKVQNPQTKEAAEEELMHTFEIFWPEYLGEKLVRDKDGNFTYKKYRKCSCTNSKDVKVSVALIPSKGDFSENTITLSERGAQLSLQDYQSVCVERNISYTAQKLINLCAKGQSEEANKIMPGFFDKYHAAVKVGNTVYRVDGDIYRQMKAEIRQNFSQIHPDFLEITAAQWKEDRKKLFMLEFENEAVSDAAYFLLATENKYLWPSEENDRIFAQKRQENDKIVQQMTEQKSQNTSHKDIQNDTEITSDKPSNSQQREENERIIEPLYPNKQSKVYAPIGDGQMIEVPAPKFNKAEIKTIVNEDDGSVTQVALIDGKKHGVELQYDKDGNILCDKDGNIDYKIYDHGKELDKSKHQIELNIQSKDGLTYSGVKMDGVDFGATIITDENGKTKAAFYEQGGAEIRASEQAKIEKTTILSRESLETQMRQDKQQQSVQMQNLDTLLYTPTFASTIQINKEDKQQKNAPFLQNQDYKSSYSDMRQTPNVSSMSHTSPESQTERPNFAATAAIKKGRER